MFLIQSGCLIIVMYRTYWDQQPESNKFFIAITTNRRPTNQFFNVTNLFVFHVWPYSSSVTYYLFSFNSHYQPTTCTGTEEHLHSPVLPCNCMKGSNTINHLPNQSETHHQQKIPSQSHHPSVCTITIKLNTKHKITSSISRFMFDTSCCQNNHWLTI